MKKNHDNIETKKKGLPIIRKLLKITLIVFLCLVVLFTAYVGLIFFKDRPSANVNESTTAGTDESTTSVTTTESTTSANVDVPTYNENKLITEKPSGVSVSLNDDAYESLLEKINGSDYEFKMAEYYALEQALERYNSVQVNKSTQTTLLTDGKVDANKFYQKVLENNSAVVDENGINQLSYLYQNFEEEEIKEICDIIVKVVNDKADEFDIEKVANTLEMVTVFKQGGSANLAFVTERLAFVVNPNLIEMFKSSQEIIGNEDSDQTWYQTICHEVMHLIQYSSGDGNKENGVEIGSARMYNSLNEEKIIPVDSLYNTWIFEAGAEILAAEYVGIETMTYQKKISYANSYNLSRFYELSSKEDKLERIAFRHTLAEVFEDLELDSEEEQLEFLRFMFSVEILQSDPDDVWEYYQSKTGREITEDERTSFRMDIRAEAVKYMSGTFFTNLINALRDGAIADLDTLFYMLRVWELDVFGHLEYSQTASLDHAEEYVKWHNDFQNEILNAVAESSNIADDQILSMYASYCLNLIGEGEVVKENCNLGGLSAEAQTLIFNLKNNYTTTKFVRISDIAAFVNS